MITLPHHVELMSDAWLEKASSYLERETAQRRERLDGKPFSLSERLIHAPPHLKLPGDVAQWSMRYDGEKVSVSRSFDERADVVVEGEYQVALMAAQAIGALAPGVMEKTYREMAHLFGKDAIRARGLLKNAAARELVGLLHDHMARRTVENPDLAHRARQLGLAGKIREVEEHGYTVLERAISPEFADELRDATLRALLPHNTFTLQWMLYQGPEFERIAQNAQLMTLIDASLGRGAVIGSLSSIRRGTGPGKIPLHTDYSMVPEPYPEFALTGVGVWAFEDWTVASGPTWIMPGTHRRRRGPRSSDSKDGGVPIEMPKGSVVYFTHGVWHWQGERTEPGERVTLHSHFNRGILRSLEPKRVDVQMMHRNAPRLGEMLGEDDWFDKLGPNGRDQLRASYMAQLQAFTDKQKRELLESPV